VTAGTPSFLSPEAERGPARDRPLSQHPTLDLNRGWSVRSSAELNAGGRALSVAGVDTSDWLSIDLPSTVLGALIAAGAVKDPFFGTNLLTIPGQGPPGQNFSNHPMPAESPFRVSWWFRKEIHIREPLGPYARLQFDGINYRANLWFNGEKIAGTNQVVGAYREYDFDVSSLVRHDGLNVMAIEVFPPRPCDLAMTWVDWNPSPPDKNMGLWRDVRLRSTGPVVLQSPHVVSRLEENDGRRRGHLTIAGDLENVTDRPRTAVMRATFDGRHVCKTFELPARARARVEIDPGDDPLLTIDHPRLWWPHTIGAPELYDICLEVSVEDTLSDAARFSFGIRDVSSGLTPDGHTQFRVNGVPVLIRGAGWAGDLFLRRERERDRAQLQYVKAMGLNAIRFEGMLERSDFLDQCDREGILVIAGWCCCDSWEKWDTWSEESHSVACESLRSQIRRVRRHPCMLTWWYGSDFPPPAEVEKRYLAVLAEERWPNPSQSNASHRPAQLTGPSGLKMQGPYDWVPPNYWLQDKERGGAFGFATEISPGPAVPPIESLVKMIPAEHLWPIDEVWNFHAGIQEFQNIRAFTEALHARYGETHGVGEFAELSQLATYEAQRAMFEAYAYRRSQCTGVIQWMLNNAWPSLIWHLYDYYLRPGGGFFGTQIACEPLHVMYAYDDHSISVINDHPRAFRGLRVEARLLSLDGRVFQMEIHEADVGAVEAATVARLPTPSLQEPYFVDLRLLDGASAILSRNFYWLPHKPDVLDGSAATWIHTPTREFADFSALRRMPRASVALNARRLGSGASGTLVHVDVENLTDRLAFFLQLRVADGGGADVLPVIWTDNYVSLLPGERRTVRARLLGERLDRVPLHIEARGLNVPTRTTPVDP
jgi:exo-1,4-beta-D-glucosaminidase